MQIDISELRDLDRWPGRKFTYETVDAFLKAAPINGIHTIDLDGLPLDLLSSVVVGQPLVIVLSANFPRGPEYKLPAFSGLGIVPGGSGMSRLSISDPILHLSDSINLGWYGGSKTIALQEILPKVIAHVVKYAKPSKIIFAGGSAAGFASMHYGRHFPGSISLVWNPQTDIRAYNADHVQKYANLAFGAPAEAANEALTENILPEVISLHPAGVKVIYLQNDTDWHVGAHMLPFFEAHAANAELGPDHPEKWFDLHICQWGEGHAPPPSELVGKMIKALALEEGNPFEKVRAILQAE